MTDFGNLDKRATFSSAIMDLILNGSYTKVKPVAG